MQNSNNGNNANNAKNGDSQTRHIVEQLIELCERNQVDEVTRGILARILNAQLSSGVYSDAYAEWLADMWIVLATERNLTRDEYLDLAAHLSDTSEDLLAVVVPVAAPLGWSRGGAC